MKNITVAVILCSFLSVGCTPETKYKHPRIFTDDNLLEEPPVKKKAAGKTDLYPGELLIKKYITNQSTTGVPVLQKENGDMVNTHVNMETPIEKKIFTGTSRVPGPKSSFEGKSVYSFNVGVFAVRQYADSFFETLKRKGYDVFILRNTRADGTLIYRVLVGRFHNKDKNFDDFKALLQKEGIESFVYNH
jgi:cell division septation protein DedD